MSYWSADNIVQIGEKQVSVPSDGGLSYQIGNNSRKVSFTIPKSIKFIDGKSSYLEWDMKIDYPAGGGNTRLQLDPAGGGMIVENLRIYSLDDRVLCEEIVGYNQIVALKSDYDTDDSRRQTRALTQGGTCYNPETASTRGSSKSEMSSLATNPWFKAPSDTGPFDAYVENTQRNTVKCCVPLDISGIFSGSIYPNMMTGLYIEIDLAPAPNIVRQLDSVVKDRRRTLNPLLHNLTVDAGAGDVVVDALAPNDTTVIKSVSLSLANSVDGVQQCPFVVGETLRFVDATTKAAADCNLINTAAANVSADFIINTITYAGGHVVLTPTILTLANGTAAGGHGRTGTEAPMTGTAGATQTAVYSTSCRDAASYEVKYTVENLNMVCHQVDLDPSFERGMLQKAREGSAIEFDIHSATNYKNSITSSEVQASFLIHTVNERAKSAVIIPTDATIYSNQKLVSSDTTYEVTADTMDTVLNSARSGISGICDDLQSVQYQLDGKLVPSRPVTTRKCATKKSIDAFHLFELEKTLDAAGITPHSFVKYLDNFVLGRSFALNRGVADLRNKDFVVNLNYGSSVAKNKMFSTFIFHIRRLRMKGGSVQVEM